MIAALLRAMGADPARVALLVGGLARATHGFEALQREHGKASLFDPRTRSVLLRVVGVLASLLIAVPLVLIRDRGASVGVGVVLLVGLAQIILLVTLAPPYVLEHDDARALGHWPVTARDVAAARLALLAVPLLELTVALVALPALVLGFAMQPWGFVGLVTAIAALAQGFALLLLFVTGLLLVRGRLGAKKARRHLAVIGSNLMVVFYLLMQLSPRSEGTRSSMPEWVMLLPVFWFASWPLLLVDADPMVWGASALGLVQIAVLLTTTLRLTTRASSPERPELARGGWDLPGRILEAVLSLFMTGPSGRALRRITMAHLRDDAQFLGHFVRMPLTIAGLIAVLVLRGDGESGRGGGSLDPAVWWAPLVVIYSLTVLHQTVGSEHPLALWLVGVAPIDHGAWAGAQRGLARSMALVPLVGGVIALFLFGELSARAGIDGVVLSILLFEVGMRAAQLQLWRMPFSRRMVRGDAGSITAITVGSMIGMPLLLGWMVFVHAPQAWGKLLTYALCLVALFALHRRARAKQAQCPMLVDLTLPG